MRFTRRRPASLTILGVALAASIAPAAPANACGAFFARASEASRHPSLAYEQTLILFDPAARREDFIREVAFRRSSAPFGFVVPTPAQPEVASVAKSPFADLREAFPFAAPTNGTGAGGGLRAAAANAPAGGVQVLEVKRVGSFTAFVLKADDEAGLTAWLGKNGFASTPETSRWVAHYVPLHFYYVAFRYTPPPHASADAPEAAETIRVSFPSPLPFYPYREPDPAPDEPPHGPRLLDVWLVSTRAFVPVAAYDAHGAGARWVRPLATGATYEDDVRSAAGLQGFASRLAPGNLLLQRFTDQKRSREGFGDIVFVPAESAHGDAVDEAQIARYAPLVDPSLAGPSR